MDVNNSTLVKLHTRLVMSNSDDSPQELDRQDSLEGLTDEEIIQRFERDFGVVEVGLEQPGRIGGQAAKALRGLNLIQKATGSLPTVNEQLKQLIGAEFEGHRPSHTNSDRLAKYYTKGTLIGDGKYRLESLIGEGGMGSVWVAEQREPMRRRVALKLIKPGMDSRQVLHRFEAERQALAAMDHPNIARVFDAGLTERDHPFFVMELVNGANLTAFCDEAHLTVRERLEIFCQIAQAIQHAHHKGVLHRDLKPSNILVTIIDGKPVPKIIDFGLAKVIGSELESAATGFGMVVGTMEYMAPEQAGYSGQDVDTRADIYSLGVILYELLTGLKPFDSDRIASAAIDEVLRIIKTEEPIRPSIRLSSSVTAESSAQLRRTEQSTLSGLLRKELDWVVMKALEKDRNRRYDSAKVFSEDIQRYLTGEPVTAHPPSLAYRLRKFIGKRRLAVMAASLVVLAMLVGLAGIIAGFIKAKQSERIAIAESKAKENALVEMQNAQLKQEQARRQALQALRSMTDEFIGAEIAREAELSIKDKTYLKNIIRQFDAFSDSASEDQEGRAIRADARVRVGRVYSYLGDQTTAETQLRDALVLWTQLMEEDPNDEQYQIGLASCRRTLGSILIELGQNTEAEFLKRAALAFWRESSEKNQNRPSQLPYASSLMDVASLCYRQLRFEEAEELYLEAIQILETYTRSPGNRERLASGLNSLAAVYERTGRMAESKQLRDRSLSLRRRNLERFSARTEFKEGLARSLVGYGYNASSRGDWTAALTSYMEAKQIYQELADQFPSMPDHRNQTADCLSRLGIVYEEQNRNLESVISFAKEIELRELLLNEYAARSDSKRNVADQLFYLGRAYAKLMEHRQAEAKFLEAIRTREQLMQELPDDQANAVALSAVYQALAYLQKELKRVDEAIHNIETAVKLRKEIADTQPENSITKQQMASTMLSEAYILNNTTRIGEAKTLSEQALGILNELRSENLSDMQIRKECLHGLMVLVMNHISLRDFDPAVALLTQFKEINDQDLSIDPNNGHYRTARRRYLYLLTQVHCGLLEHQSAKETSKQLRNLGWDPSRDAYFAASSLSLCLPVLKDHQQIPEEDRKRLSQEYSQQAIDYLSQAFELGYGDKHFFDNDRDLDPLRDRADFQKLMHSIDVSAKQ